LPTKNVKEEIGTESPLVSEANFSFGTFTSFNIISLMVYTYSAVRVRRGAGAIAGGVVGCAGTTTTDEYSAINIATDAAATTRRNRRFSNLTIRYRAAIRLRIENLSNRISNYKDHGISKSG
jgi:hypothetical protein